MSLIKSDKTFISIFKMFLLGVFIIAVYGVACDSDDGEADLLDPVTPMVEDVVDDVVDDVVESDVEEVEEVVDVLEEAETEDVQEEVDSSDSDQ